MMDRRSPGRPAIACRNLSKDYLSASGRTFRALNGISLDVSEGEFVVLVGASGSGKSTLLRMAAGIERPSSGSVERQEMDGRVGFVFQGESVFPWRTVAQNLAFSGEARRLSSTKIATRSRELCRLIGLEYEQFHEKFPRELSGGEARRLALGIALSCDADLLMFDEATSQLDYVSRIAIQDVVQQIWLETRATILHVTHDVEEAILLGQRIVVLRKGSVVDEVVVDFSFPRERTITATADFQSHRDRILACMRGPG